MVYIRFALIYCLSDLPVFTCFMPSVRIKRTTNYHDGQIDDPTGHRATVADSPILPISRPQMQQSPAGIRVAGHQTSRASRSVASFQSALSVSASTQPGAGAPELRLQDNLNETHTGVSGPDDEGHLHDDSEVVEHLDVIGITFLSCTCQCPSLTMQSSIQTLR